MIKLFNHISILSCLIPPFQHFWCIYLALIVTCCCYCVRGGGGGGGRTIWNNLSNDIVDIEMHVEYWIMCNEIFLLYITWAIRCVWEWEASYLCKRLCVCVCGLCKCVTIQTLVAVVYFAHIYALATTICCSFFFFSPKRTLQRTNYFIENNECSSSNNTTTLYISFFLLLPQFIWMLNHICT